MIYDERKNGLQDYFLKAVIVLLAFACVIYLIDSGPMTLPISESFETIDCDSISYHKFEIINKSLYVYFNTTETYQYPMEYLPYYIKFLVKNGNHTFWYSANSMIGIKKDNDNSIVFELGHNIAGLTDVTIYCLRKETGYFKAILKEVHEDLADYSSKPLNSGNALHLNNVCFENDTILFFGLTNSTDDIVNIDERNIKITFLKSKITDYMNNRNASKVNEEAYLLPRFQIQNWKILLFNLLPLVKSIFSRDNVFSKKYIFYNLNSTKKGIRHPELLHYFSNNVSNTINNVSCFKSITIPSFPKKIDFTEEAKINDSLSSNFTLLQKLMSYNQNNLSISIFKHLSSLVPPVKEICPKCLIQVINPEMKIPQIAKLVSSSHLLSLI